MQEGATWWLAHLQIRTQHTRVRAGLFSGPFPAFRCRRVVGLTCLVPSRHCAAALPHRCVDAFLNRHAVAASLRAVLPHQRIALVHRLSLIRDVCLLY